VLVAGAKDDQVASLGLVSLAVVFELPHSFDDVEKFEVRMEVKGLRVARALLNVEVGSDPSGGEVRQAGLYFSFGGVLRARGHFQTP